MSSEALRLFKQLNLQLEQEGRFQPREKGLSLIESAAEVRGGRREARSWGGGWVCAPRGALGLCSAALRKLLMCLEGVVLSQGGFLSGSFDFLLFLP